VDVRAGARHPRPSRPLKSNLPFNLRQQQQLLLAKIR
jgi:hypothetical protein